MNGEAECPADLEMTAPKNQGEPPAAPRYVPVLPEELLPQLKIIIIIINKPQSGPFLRGMAEEEGGRRRRDGGSVIPAGIEVGGSASPSSDPCGEHTHMEHMDPCSCAPAALGCSPGGLEFRGLGRGGWHRGAALPAHIWAALKAELLPWASSSQTPA